MRQYDVCSLGEILIDFTPLKSTDISTEQRAVVKNPCFEANPGGAPANVAAAVAKLGGKSAFIGKAGNDYFAELAFKTLHDCGVNLDGTRKDTVHHTSFAFVALDACGERTFTFCRDDGADVQLDSSEVDLDLIKQSTFLHIGALSCTSQPCKDATFHAILNAKKEGCLISYDPNWRALLWNDRKQGIEMSKKLFDYADFIKISDDEVKLFFDKPYEDAARNLIDCGASLVCVTLGAEGVYYASKTYSGTVGIAKGVFPVCDTTGAGDAFTGALLYRLSRRENPLNISQTELESDLRFANTSAAICVGRRGAIPALASLKEVTDRL